MLLHVPTNLYTGKKSVTFVAEVMRGQVQTWFYDNLYNLFLTDCEDKGLKNKLLSFVMRRERHLVYEFHNAARVTNTLVAENMFPDMEWQVFVPQGHNPDVSPKPDICPPGQKKTDIFVI